ncbi:cytochrome c6 PetJ [Planktothrix sp. FACHB-1365]|uniref:cytochrome c6 PetJ n=1 Tax=Planktothrix sp. FACHB-1365 TaxID=2692855 RepID=UPI001686ABDE|nr:c-type cytochrome [Planktothrix sp. FACHB-1365]MBD2485036.1 c-type cytochrome [Planktothrix sp. FACHB-1365]
MKKLISALLMIAVAVLIVVPSALAGDVANGGKVFSANCASCHAGGKNLVNAKYTLQKADLEKYGMYSIEAITTQVTNGKGAMPSFKGRLKPEQIADVATYVLSQADQGWKK